MTMFYTSHQALIKALSVIGKHIGSCDDLCERCQVARDIEEDLRKAFNPENNDQ